jgi:vancomycin resistance protein YoaR
VKKPWLVMTAISSVILISLMLVFVMPSLSYPKVYKGVTIQGVDLSGRSREEVAQLLSVWQKEYSDKYIMLYYGEMVFKVEGASIDLDIDANRALDAAWSYGRDGTWWERIKKIRIAAQHGYNIPLSIQYNEDKLSNLIAQWQEVIERPARNATLSMITGGLIPEQQGCRLETDALRPLVLQAFMKSEDNSIALPVTALSPNVTITDITNTGIREALSVYTTVFNNEDINRTANIKLAAWKVNGYIIYPGKTFSFNEIVGPREKSYGFKEALEIVNGEFVPGVGGGICQLSSTLYNAVILANLDIVERSNHSKRLSYVPLGRDATVVYGGLDFKFANNTSEPVMIMSEVNGNKLMVGIFGKRRIAETVEIMSVEQEVIPPAIVKKQDDSLYLGEFKIDKQGNPGYAVTTVRVVRLQGQEVKREVLSKDRYLPDNTIVKVGTQIPTVARKDQ